MANSFSDIAAQMAAVGIEVPATHEIDVTGKGYRRFRPVGQKANKKSAWYKIYENRSKSGRTFFSGSFGIRSECYLIKPSFDTWTVEERAEARAQAAEAARQVEADRKKLAWDAATKAEHLWKRARELVDASHAYLQKKQVRAFGIRQIMGQLLIPLRRSSDFALVGLQHIQAEKNADGNDKTFTTGAKVQGACHVIGNIAPEVPVLFAEGYATAASLHQACGFPVVVCFNAGNIEPVVKSFRELYPDSQFVICGDDDRHLTERYVARLAKFGITSVHIDGETRRYEHPEFGDVYVSAKWETSKADQFAIVGEIRYKRGELDVRQQLAIENAGRVAAAATAAKFRCRILLPKFANEKSPGTDFNDLQVEESADMVARQITDGLSTPWEPAAAKRTNKKASGSGSTLDDRFTLIYGTDTVFDATEREIVRVGAFKLAFRDAADMWLDSANRKMIRADHLTFAPGQDLPDTFINLFDGFPLRPDARKPYERIVEHLRMLCGYDDGLFEWVVKWLAYPLQHPGAKMHTALVMHGRREGTGKSIIFDLIMAPIYGRYARVVNQSLLNSDFNGWVSRCMFCVGDEVLTRQDRTHAKGMLKNLITTQKHQINEKNLPVREEPNHTNFVFVSNEIQPIVLDELDRRYTVVYIDSPKPAAYFVDLMEEVNGGGIEGFYGWLMRYPLGDFAPHTKPYDNAARRRLIALGMTAERRFYEYWSAGDLDFPFVPCLAKHLYQAFQVWSRSAGEKFIATQTAFLTTIALQDNMRRKKMRVQIYKSSFDLTNTHATEPEGGSTDPYQGIVYIPPDLDAEGQPMPIAEQEVQFGIYKFQKSLARFTQDTKRAQL